TIFAFSATLRLLRRSLVLVCSAALVLATAATAQLKPIRLPHKGDRTLARVRHGVIRIPAGHVSGRVTVLVDLRLPPLAAARGQGVKIGVVDDGIDAQNPFFNPAGFSYPAGFPKGQKKFTTPKVIVARAFPGPGSGKQGRLPLYRADSFHGTHVAGIAAGVQGTVAFAGPDHPQVAGLSGIAPRAWLGNYRVFNTPVPTRGDDAFTPQIVKAFETAVRDGMDVINFSGGGPEVDPAADALVVG